MRSGASCCTPPGCACLKARDTSSAGPGNRNAAPAAGFLRMQGACLAAEQARRAFEHVDAALECTKPQLPLERLQERPGWASCLPQLQPPQNGHVAAPRYADGGPCRRTPAVLQREQLVHRQLPRPLLSPPPRCWRVSGAGGAPCFTSPRPTKRAAFTPAQAQDAVGKRRQSAAELQRPRRSSSSMLGGTGLLADAQEHYSKLSSYAATASAESSSVHRAGRAGKNAT